MVHDCMFTKNYFVLLDLPVILDPEVVEAGFSLPYKWHPEYGARVGLLPRDGTADDVTWHEVEPCYVFHPMNGYEDADGRVVLDVVRHPKMFATDMQGPNEGSTTLDRWLIDPKGGPVKEERLDDRGQEFPRLDERRAGKSYRYGYSVGLGKGFDIGGLRKIDLRSGEVLRHQKGEGVSYMEPVFVPRSDAADEDDGWLLAYTYDATRNGSDVIILHAQDFAADPVATIALPQRVPFGFHGNWVADV
jgi:carotenoid cleavage dioxygenase